MYTKFVWQILRAFGVTTLNFHVIPPCVIASITYSYNDYILQLSASFAFISINCVVSFVVQIKIQHVLRETTGEVLFRRQTSGRGEEGARLLASGCALAQQAHHRRVNIGLMCLCDGTKHVLRGKGT